MLSLKASSVADHEAALSSQSHLCQPAVHCVSKRVRLNVLEVNNTCLMCFDFPQELAGEKFRVVNCPGSGQGQFQR